MSLANRCAKLPVLVRRMIALLVVPLLAGLVCAAICLPALYLRDAQTQWRDDARRLLSQAKHAPAAQAALNQEIAAMRGSALWAKFYPASGAVPGATSLHTDVGTLLVAVQASAQLLTPIPTADLPSFAKIGARVAVSMRVNQLRDLMTALSNHPRYLRVERLMVVAPQMQSPEENPALAVTMDIYGYELSGDAEARTEEGSVLAMRALP